MVPLLWKVYCSKWDIAWSIIGRNLQKIIIFRVHIVQPITDKFDTLKYINWENRRVYIENNYKRLVFSQIVCKISQKRYMGIKGWNIRILSMDISQWSNKISSYGGWLSTIKLSLIIINKSHYTIRRHFCWNKEIMRLAIIPFFYLLFLLNFEVFNFCANK